MIGLAAHGRGSVPSVPCRLSSQQPRVAAMPEATRAVFLSYAREDGAVVEVIAGALRTAGIEVWFDRNELLGGDAWDRKIRAQIKDCALFMPVISATTQRRAEGYFRLEWKLAVDRSHLIADDRAFLVPVIIDDTPEAAARVPERFREVQWTRLPGGVAPHEFVGRVRHLLEPAPNAPAAAPAASPAAAPRSPQAPQLDVPPRRRTAVWIAAAGVAAVVAAGLVYSLRRGPPTPASGAAGVASQPAAESTDFRAHLAAGRLAEAEVALQPAGGAATPAAAVQIAFLRLIARGETEGALARLETLRPADRKANGAPWIEAFAQLLRGDGDRMLAVLQGLPEDASDATWDLGSRAYLAGLAHQLARRPDAARQEWARALARLESARTGGDDAARRLHRAELLALLGRKDEADAALRAVLAGAGSDGHLPRRLLVQTQAALGRAADVAETLSRADDSRDVWPVTAVWLMLDPRCAPVRDEVSVQRQIIARARAQEQRADSGFPRDPDLRRAMNVLERDVSRADYDLADQIVRGVLDRRPMDAEALAVMARVQVTFLFRGFDRSEERFTAARRSAERAVQLAPDDPEAIAALGIYFLVRGGADRPRALPLLKRAVALRPQSAYFRRFLNNALSNLVHTGVEEMERRAALPRGTSLAESLAQLFPDDALVQYELALYHREKGNLTAMEQALDAAVKLQPVTNALIWKAYLALWQRGDVEGMRRHLEEVTDVGRTFERYAVARWELAMVSGRPEEGLDVLRSLTGAWLEDFQYVGPKSLLIADLLKLQGKTSLAALEYEAALLAVRRERERTPNQVWLQMLEGWALIGLGRLEEARRLSVAYEEALRRPFRMPVGGGFWFSIVPFHVLTGRHAKAGEYLGEAVKNHPLGSEAARAEYRRRLQLDPRLRSELDAPWVNEALR